MLLSSRLQRFNEPETLKMAKLGRELKAQGIDITDLSLGEPDFDTPTHIKDAAKKAIDENYSHYTPVAGIVELREAVCNKLKRDNNLDYTTNQVIISTGAKQSIANAVLSIVDIGDEVIIPTPYWVTYSEIVRLAQGEVKFVHTTFQNNYKITATELKNAITEKTKLFMFSSPCNPTGAVYSYEELSAIALVLKDYPNIFILSDEIYEYINFVGKHQSIAQFNFLKDRIIIINGLSKGYAMTGWRLGYMVANEAVARACEKIQGQFTSAATSITQRAAITALNGDLAPTKSMIKEFDLRKKRVVELMSEIPNIKCNIPEGAFYVFPKVSEYFGKSDGEEVIKNADDLCMYLLHKYHLSTVTGKAFGEPSCIRISFANSMQNIEKGFEKLKTALSHLK